MKKMKKIDCIDFKHEGEKFRLLVHECSYCDNRVLKLEHVDMSEAGSPYGRVNYSHQGYMAGGRKEQMLLCDACMGMSKKIKEIKKLEERKEKIIYMLENLSGSIEQARQDIKHDIAVAEGRIQGLTNERKRLGK